MTPQERDLTTILLDRLSKTEGQPKDTEAETLIRDTTAERPDAPYSLVQTVLIQDLSLHDAQIKITGLETKLTETKCALSAPPSFLGGPSFLGAVFGRIEPSGGARTSNVPPGGPIPVRLRSLRRRSRVISRKAALRHPPLLALDCWVAAVSCARRR